VIGARPMNSACPPVNTFMADNAMLKSGVARSMANMLMVFGTPLLTNVRFQHVPQLGELNPVIAGAPPMLGKLGNEPKVVNPLVSMPLEPLEHETVARDCFALSYTWLKVTLRADAKAGRMVRTKGNFIVLELIEYS